jgi:uncharacterized protein YcfL
MGVPLFKYVPLIALASLLSAGCASTSGIEASGWVLPDGSQPENNKSVLVNNRALASDIEIIDVKSVFVGNMLKAQVALQSKNRATVALQYRFEWLDAQGLEISANQAWKPFLIYGKEVKSIQGVAPDPRVREFKLKLRDPDENTGN